MSKLQSSLDAAIEMGPRAASPSHSARENMPDIALPMRLFLSPHQNSRIVFPN
jgi:hypothetical protein